MTVFCIDLKSFYASVECVLRGLDPYSTKLVVTDEERGPIGGAGRNAKIESMGVASAAGFTIFRRTRRLYLRNRG